MNKINLIKGFLEIQNDDGSREKLVGSGDAENACLKEDGLFILITRNNGKVELWTATGTYLWNIGKDNAESAFFYDDNIKLILSNGSIELRSMEDRLILVL